MESTKRLAAEDRQNIGEAVRGFIKGLGWNKGKKSLEALKEWKTMQLLDLDAFFTYVEKHLWDIAVVAKVPIDRDYCKRHGLHEGKDELTCLCVLHELSPIHRWGSFILLYAYNEEVRKQTCVMRMSFTDFHYFILSGRFQLVSLSKFLAKEEGKKNLPRWMREGIARISDEEVVEF